jgi:hypothetical protein
MLQFLRFSNLGRNSPETENNIINYYLYSSYINIEYKQELIRESLNGAVFIFVLERLGIVLLNMKGNKLDLVYSKVSVPDFNKN